MKIATNHRVMLRTPLAFSILIAGAIGYLLGSTLQHGTYEMRVASQSAVYSQTRLQNNPETKLETTQPPQKPLIEKGREEIDHLNAKNNPSSSALQSSSLKIQQGNTSSSNKFAYVFYITLADYYCGALVNAHQLINSGKDPNIDILILTSANFQPTPQQSATADSLKIKHMSVDLLPLGTFDTPSGTFASYYEHSMVKLSIFSLYKQGYTRLIFLDSDSLILKSLDDLFYLPSVGLAAPRAYWIDPGPLKPNCGSATWVAADGPEVGLQQKFTSALMVVEPSEALWSRLQSKYWPNDGKANFTNLFDMDLLNIEFKDEVMLLPGSMLRLSSDWSPEGRLNSRHIPGNEEKFDQIVFDSTYVLHFSWAGKVWSMSTEAFELAFPTAHPFAKKIWQMWWAVGGVDGVLKCAELGPGGTAPIRLPEAVQSTGM